jgi:hypothetical protein
MRRLQPVIFATGTRAAVNLSNSGARGWRAWSLHGIFFGLLRGRCSSNACDPCDPGVAEEQKQECPNDSGSDCDNGSASVAAAGKATTMIARSLRQASREPELVKTLDLSSSGSFVCKNMFCEKVGQSCVCRLSLWISQTSPRLTALTTLSLANNGLEQLPDSLGELRNIKRLDFSQNNIRDVPSSLGELRQLEVLDLRGNPKLSAGAVARVRVRLPGVAVSA